MAVHRARERGSPTRSSTTSVDSRIPHSAGRPGSAPHSRLPLVVLALLFSLLAGPLVGDAPPAERVVRIGYLSLQTEEGDRGWFAAFRQGPRELGYVEGPNVVIEQRHAAGRAERLPALASELVQLKLDVLVVYGLWALNAAGWKPPGALPIVFYRGP